MIGNDIVDLAEAKRRSSWKRKGFLEKIFTKEEQSKIMESSNPEKILWTIWSVKESLYKASVKSCNEKYFCPLNYEYIPKKFSKSHSYEYSKGEIFLNNFLYKTESVITENYISTIVFNNNIELDILKNNIKFSGASYHTQHSEIYSAVLKKISDIFIYSLEDLRIMKEEYGIPYIYLKQIKLNCSISLSHHGKYGAYAITIK